MNIFEKLQECRAKLMSQELKQTGVNKFSNYTYFELGDFLPRAIEIMKELKMTSIFGFTKEEATLLIVDSEKPEEKILFSTPSVIPQLKGTSEIQNIGASQTYMRRYLYTMALEISDFDMVNTSEPGEKKEEEEVGKELVTDVAIKALDDLLQAKGQKADLERYKLLKIEDMTKEQYFDYVAYLRKMPDKKQPNLGLE